MRKFGKKLGTFLLAGALVLGAVGTIGNVDANAAGINFDVDEAEEIELDEKIEGSLEEKSSSEYDAFRFTTGEGEITENWYSISFKDMNRENPNVIGAKLYLYDEDRNVINSIEASSSEETYIYEKLENNTDYYITVSHRSNGNPCDYYFKVEEREDEAGEGVDDAAEIKVNTEYKNYFQVRSEYDVYKFTVTTNEQKIKVKNCQAKARYTLALKWEVLDEDGVAVKDVKDTFYGVESEESKEYNVKLEPGVYYIRFKASINLQYSDEGKYVFSIEEASAKKSADSAMALTSLTMSKGDSVTLEAFFADKNATCSWSSSKSTVVKVSSAGKLTAKKKGTAKITCKNKTTGEKMVLKVVVK